MLVLAILVHIGRVETRGQIEVYLQSSTLPITANCIGQNVFEFRTIESTFAFENRVGLLEFFKSIFQRVGGLLPRFN
ncbi:hypothetical protein D3C87_1827740 [compost metagenome]